MSVEKTHEQKESIAVDVFEPGHEARTVTATFRSTKRELEKELGTPRCFICNATASESGEPLEAHHVVIERCYTVGVDWHKVKADFSSIEPEVVTVLAKSEHQLMKWIARIASFDWASFNPRNEDEAYAFVDSMLANGLMLCKKHHTGKDEGIHWLPFPIFIFQRYAKEGYKFSPTEIIHDFV